METDQKKKLNEILQDLEGPSSGKWKEIIEQNKDEFEKIKKGIRKKQKELTQLVSKKNTRIITDDQFETETKKIQQELYDLESEILKLRFQRRK